MAEVKARRMDPKVANTAYVGTVLLRAYEADAAATAAKPDQSCVPLIYRALTKDREPAEIYDYQTGKLITPEPPALPATASPATPTGIAQPDEVMELDPGDRGGDSGPLTSVLSL
jgi:hypothetical protein